MPTRERSPVGAAVLFAVLTLLVIVAAGAVYERVQRQQDRKRSPRIGRAVDIGGRTLNIYCSGSGTPTVIFESGPPMPGYAWAFIQREIATFTRACWYDRAGYGWSDLGPDPRDGAAIANDLHTLLNAAGVRSPYLLVGTTFGALYARIYARRYPDEVASLVLADPVRTDEGTDPKSKGPVPQFLHKPQSLLAQGLNQIGVVRLLGLGSRRAPSNPPPGLTSQEWTTIWALRNEPKTRTALLQELATDFRAEDRAVGILANIPVIVLSSGSGQYNVSRLSTRYKFIPVADGDDPIQFRAPGAITSATRDLVSDLRASH